MSPLLKPEHVAIIGGGPSGMTLALALSKQGIRSTVFEMSHSIPKVIGGGILLSPNALRILDHFGVYRRIVDKGYQFENLDFTTEEGKLIDRHCCGHESLYQYKALRVMRQTFVEELQAAISEEENMVEVVYDAKFTGLVQEPVDGAVIFGINGENRSADMLVGADGISSRVRRSIFPDAKAAYSGLVGIRSYVPRSEMTLDRSNRALAISGRNGAVLMFPEDAEDSMAMVATQKPHEELDRTGWAALQSDKDRLKAMLRQDYDSWGKVNRMLIDSMCQHQDSLFMWPFYVIPPLEEWSALSGRIVLVGDAAHAVHPLTGQGVNQAIESVSSLALALNAVSTGSLVATKALEVWQSWRKERLEGVARLAQIMQVKRLPKGERERQEKGLERDVRELEDGKGQYAWLFGVDVDSEMNAALINARQSSNTT
ncbi:MAG: hypothetical protein Q9159_001779 [Coniocarpon cinnabarinum]